jgi:hypothetical protein
LQAKENKENQSIRKIGGWIKGRERNHVDVRFYGKNSLNIQRYEYRIEAGISRG